MKLNFSKENGVWVAEVGVTADFNLHLERVDDGLIKVMQRTPIEGEYVDTDIWDAGKPCYKNFDCDVAAFVYPKWIKVISGTEVITASVNFNEGGGSGSCEESFEYYRIDWDNKFDLNQGGYDDNFYINHMIASATLAECNGEIKNVSFVVREYNDGNIELSDIKKIACPNLGQTFVIGFLDYGSWIKNIKQLLLPTDDTKYLIPITKEEFYNLKVPE